LTTPKYPNGGWRAQTRQWREDVYAVIVRRGKSYGVEVALALGWMDGRGTARARAVLRALERDGKLRSCLMRVDHGVDRRYYELASSEGGGTCGHGEQ
jgi:hypothetical protein